eukprot:COSAG02_NODE_1194_length_13955_cov_7.341055_2_plen_75_part_00
MREYSPHWPPWMWTSSRIVLLVVVEGEGVNDELKSCCECVGTQRAIAPSHMTIPHTASDEFHTKHTVSSCAILP